MNLALQRFLRDYLGAKHQEPRRLDVTLCQLVGAQPLVAINIQGLKLPPHFLLVVPVACGSLSTHLHFC